VQEAIERCPKEHRVEKGYFDRRVSDERRPRCMFNVLMIKQIGEVSHRVAVGRVHVGAVLASGRGRRREDGSSGMKYSLVLRCQDDP
jgi:hypothetical protein